MDKRAAIPVTLPRSNPTVSYWQDPPHVQVADYVHAESLPEEVVDTVIVGSGITGTRVAYGLLEGKAKPIGRVVMLEARQACSGATGRNGGHTKAGSYRYFPSNASSYSLLTAIQIARLEYANVIAVHAFAREHNIECDLFSGDTVDVIYDAGQWEQTKKAVGMMRDSMPDDLEGAAKYALWTPQEAREKFFCAGDDKIFGAVSYRAGSLSAYKLVIGVLEMCLGMGLELFTNTPALKVEKGADGMWTITTTKGVLKAKRVVLATNGYTAFLAPKFQGKIVPLRGQITAHRPGISMPKEGLPTTYSFIYENGYEYMIPRPTGSRFAGDIVIGGGLVKAKDEGLEEFGTTDDTTINSEISAYLTATTKTYFGTNWGADDPEGRVRKEWTGIMGYSADGFPFVGEVPGEKDLWVAASFQGHGMVLCWMCGKALVAMIEERGEENEGWFPEVYKVSEKRLGEVFTGRLHTKVESKTKI